MLLPTNMVEIYWSGLRKKIPNILLERLRCFLSNSYRNLLEEIKAISIPEKKAEKANDIIMYVNVAFTILYLSLRNRPVLQAQPESHPLCPKRPLQQGKYPVN